MANDKNTLHFTLIFRDTEYPVQTTTKKYYSLMTLISDYLAIPAFGLCSGMGSCGTCMIQIIENFSNRKSYGLSCGIQLNDNLANTRIIIIDTSF